MPTRERRKVKAKARTAGHPRRIGVRPRTRPQNNDQHRRLPPTPARRKSANSTFRGVARRAASASTTTLSPASVGKRARRASSATSLGTHMRWLPGGAFLRCFGSASSDDFACIVLPRGGVVEAGTTYPTHPPRDVSAAPVSAQKPRESSNTTPQLSLVVVFTCRPLLSNKSSTILSSRPSLVKFRPNSAEMLAKFGHHRATFGRVRPESAGGG